MTLREFAALVGAPEKWVLNARAALGIRGGYTIAGARRLAVAYEIVSALALPLRAAYENAQEALTQHALDENPVVIRSQAHGHVGLWLDLRAILAAQATRRSAFLSLATPKERGPKPARPRNALARAKESGIDLTLLTANLRRTPEERLRQLDAMASFRRKVRRSSAPRDSVV